MSRRHDTRNYLTLNIYLFKIKDRRTRGPLRLSEVHKNTQIYTIRKRTERLKTNKNQIKHKKTQSSIQSKLKNTKTILVLNVQLKL